MPCSSQGSPGDRQRKTSSYTPSLAPIPPARVLEEILWRRRSGISLGTPLATSPPLYRADGGEALSQLWTKLDDVAEPLGVVAPPEAEPLGADPVLVRARRPSLYLLRPWAPASPVGLAARLRPADHANGGNRAQVLDQHLV